MSQKLNILLVEDTAGDAAIIEFYLAEQFADDYNFFHVDKFKDCLHELKIKKYDVVLLDLDLPDSQGLETIKTLMTTYPEQLVIVLTGLNDEKTGLATVQKGANDYMVKGKFDADMLNSKIRFAHERSLAKIKRNNQQFDDETIMNILSVFKAGYLEIEKKHLIITKIQMNNLGHLFELPVKNLTHLCSFINNCESLKERLLEICETEGRFQFEESVISGQSIILNGTYSQANNTICVVIADKI